MLEKYLHICTLYERNVVVKRKSCIQNWLLPERKRLSEVSGCCSAAILL